MLVVILVSFFYFLFLVIDKCENQFYSMIVVTGEINLTAKGRDRGARSYRTGGCILNAFATIVLVAFRQAAGIQHYILGPPSQPHLCGLFCIKPQVGSIQHTTGDELTGVTSLVLVF